MISTLRTSKRPLAHDASGRLSFAKASARLLDLFAFLQRNKSFASTFLAGGKHKTSPLLAICCWMIMLSSCVNAQSLTKTAGSTPEVEPTSVQSGMAMPISGIQTVFANDLTQWDVFDYDGERAGTLNLRFPALTTGTGDLTQWVFRMGDFDGVIKPKVTGRDDFWEIRVNNEVVTMRPLFAGRYDQWAISDGARSRIVYAVRDFALLEYWSTRGPGGPGLVEMYTRFEGDPTDWEFYDEATKPVSPAQQLAMLWLPVYIRLTAL